MADLENVNVEETENVDTEQQNGGDSAAEQEETKTFTQAEIDKMIEKRLKREQKKWENKSKETLTNESSDDINPELEKIKNEKNDLQSKLVCFEMGVSKDSVKDVSALAKAYMDDNTDFEDAVEKVLKKYPHFKVKQATETTENNGSWGNRQTGSNKKPDGVEDYFLKRNPGLKI
jgi:uncharacterized coiled-coil DUF342 family protein